MTTINVIRIPIKYLNKAGSDYWRNKTIIERARWMHISLRLNFWNQRTNSSFKIEKADVNLEKLTSSQRQNLGNPILVNSVRNELIEKEE